MPTTTCAKLPTSSPKIGVADLLPGDTFAFFAVLPSYDDARGGDLATLMDPANRAGKREALTVERIERIGGEKCYSTSKATRTVYALHLTNGRTITVSSQQKMMVAR